MVLILGKFFDKFQLKMKNRESAGNILAGTLRDILKKVNGPYIIVVGLPRRGICNGRNNFQKTILQTGYDDFEKGFMLPHNEEIAIGAVAEDGTTYLNNTLIEELKISNEYANKELSYQLQEIKRLTGMYYKGKKTFLDGKFITDNDKTIVIVGDGAATRSTIITTSGNLRKKIQSQMYYCNHYCFAEGYNRCIEERV